MIKLTILVVEDDRFHKLYLLQSLKEHKVVFAKNLKEAESLFSLHDPNMVFLDITLPDGSGFSLLEKFKQTNPHTHVIMVTGSDKASDAKKAKELGAEGYIVKPFQPARIQQYIENFNILNNNTE